MSELGRVLIADDDAVNRAVLFHTLGRQGHDVVAVEDGTEALAAFRSQPFDLVLLDVVMPGMDGYDVLRSLKADPTRAHVPVIMISGLDEIESVVRCIELGAEDYLSKPFDPLLLRARINSGLAKKRLHDLELEYLEQVDRVIEAAAAVEDGKFDPEPLSDVAQRTDALGRLARVFQSMATEVHAREQRLRRDMQALRIEIDEQKAAQRVAEITETDYFHDLQLKVSELRLGTEGS